MKNVFTQHLIHPEAFPHKILSYISEFNPCVYMDSHNHIFHAQQFGTYDLLAAIGKTSEYKGSGASLLKTIRDVVSQNHRWLFGYLAYDIKNQLENLHSKNFDGLEFPELYFFQPRIIFVLRKSKLEIQSDVESVESLKGIYRTVEKSSTRKTADEHRTAIMHRMPLEYYKRSVKEILHHIGRGDIYEMNFCQEFYTENAKIEPYSTYLRLKSISPTPFSAYLSFDHKYLISASPERFLKKTGAAIISQPMKGTIERGDNDTDDNLLRQRLFADPKERAENIMITDLVRNDLSKTALKGSVRVEELCGIYTYKLWHQMISTIVSEVSNRCNPFDIIINAFPMGSMTGAPKIKAMQLIEELELTRRGLFSGALGYFSPEGDFDFNVVIRSILFNAKNKYLSFQTGGAITALSNPENEYRECLLKAKGIMKVLNAN